MLLPEGSHGCGQGAAVVSGDRLPVPCGPCLRALLAPEGSCRLHDCALTTSLAVEGNQLLVGPETDCPCRCPTAEESVALTEARAQARKGADAVG